jgi:hypothetical protein
LIAGRREIGDTPGDDGIDRLSNDTVLKKRLVQIDYVIDDNLRSRRREGLNIRRERGYPVERRGEG